MTERTDTWIERVREADREAEAAWGRTVALRDDLLKRDKDPALLNWLVMVAIAAELRAARIARRPGAGGVT
jgi:hypothetical protein